MSDQNYKPSFFVVPFHITELPDITFAFLKFYETIFQFWNKGLNCFLSNSIIMERTGIKSISTINDAFQFFEKHNEMRREVQNGQRYIIQPERKIKTDCLSKRGIAPAIGGYRSSDSGGIAPAIYNNKNLNKEINCVGADASLTQSHKIIGSISDMLDQESPNRPHCPDWSEDEQDTCIKIVPTGQIGRSESSKLSGSYIHTDEYLQMSVGDSPSAHTDNLFKTPKEKCEKAAFDDLDVQDIFKEKFRGRAVTYKDLFESCQQHYEQKGSWVTLSKWESWVKREKIENHIKGDAIKPKHTETQEERMARYRSENQQELQRVGRCI
jgi:hypothetical protein